MFTFCWVAKWPIILTNDNLKRRNHIIVNGCPMCLRDEETVHHLIIHCRFALRVGLIILNMFDLQ